MKEKEDKTKNKGVQSLQYYNILEYLSETDTETQVRTLKFLAGELILTNITAAKEILGLSYNGVKNHTKTVKISKTPFAILKNK